MGINTPKKNRIDRNTADQTLIAGFSKHGSAISGMMIAGAAQTTQEIVAALQSRIDSAKTALSTKATWQAAIRSDAALHDATRTYVSAVRQGLLIGFAGQLDTLADFGLTARAKHVATPEEKIAAAAKAKATRAARHTLGSKQKAAIKGAVHPTAPATPPSPPPTPLTPPATLAPPAAPPTSPVSPTHNA